MTYRAYSYLVRREIALLNEDEWSLVEPFTKNMISGVIEFIRDRDGGIEEARLQNPKAKTLLDKYHELTGDRLGHPDEIWAVRMSRYGRLCTLCGKPFRTPKAKLCAECGFELANGEIAGPLNPWENSHGPS